MKKFYEAPKLTNHGNVSSITEASTATSPADTVFGEDGVTIIGTLTGSPDACTNGVNIGNCN
jgi:hypothetical protein